MQSYAPKYTTTQLWAHRSDGESCQNCRAVRTLRSVPSIRRDARIQLSLGEDFAQIGYIQTRLDDSWGDFLPSRRPQSSQLREGNKGGAARRTTQEPVFKATILPGLVTRAIRWLAKGA